MKKIAIKSMVLLIVICMLTFACSIALAEDTISNVPDEVYQIIQKLNNSENGIPDTVTKNDLERVINEGGSEGIEALNHIYETAIPITPPPIDENQVESYSREAEEHYSYTYNLDTGKVVYEDGNEFDHPANPMDTDNSLSITRNHATNEWFTTNPQDYSDTRATCKLFIFTKTKQTYAGSGWLVSKDDVVTAGHCIYNTDFGADNWPEYIIVMPSYSKQYQGGYYGPSIDASLVEVGGNWANNSDWKDDWGIIHLDKGFSCGYYTPLLAGNDILGWGIRLEGYWVDDTVSPPVPYHDLFNSWGIVYMAYERDIMASVAAHPGMSGGPVMDDRGFVIGIVRGGFGNGEAAMIKFDDWLYNKVMSNR